MSENIRTETLRRLGNTWEHPVDRAFVREWLSGLIPDCEDCGRTIPTHYPDENVCQSCEDYRSVEARNVYYDMVLVEEEYGFRFWAWFPDPSGMTDGELLHLWREVYRFDPCIDFQETLGGDWVSVSDTGWWDYRDEFEGRRDMRIAHIHEDCDSYLMIRYPDHHVQPDTKTLGGSRVALHRGHPKRG